MGWGGRRCVVADEGVFVRQGGFWRRGEWGGWGGGREGWDWG